MKGRPIFHAGTNMKGAVAKKRTSRKELKSVSYTLQATEPPHSVTNSPI